MTIVCLILGFCLGRVLTSDRKYSLGYEAGYEDALYYSDTRKT